MTDQTATQTRTDPTSLIALKPTSTPLAAAEREARLADPGFGRFFTDHMVTIAWDDRPWLARRPAGAVRPALARPGDHGRCTTARRSSRG